ncbi:hypothetical protein FRX31_022134 [Thalictrum thalictroides]|uniref:Uncharacterized protein n=1 Tax=Thalictrum thalictroides TaxID=46969 RepID=A0A7J6VUL2_THATH|nr:hypothetical protein FRX31_022134 [Thalictrum thalictroides]
MASSNGFTPQESKIQNNNLPDDMYVTENLGELHLKETAKSSWPSLNFPPVPPKLPEPELQNKGVISDKRKAISSNKRFPPPIKNPVSLKSYRQNGRLIIKIANDPASQHAAAAREGQEAKGGAGQQVGKEPEENTVEGRGNM